jgi:hypothetical protein
LLKLRKNGVFHPFRTSEIKTKTDEDKKLLQASAEGEGFQLFGIYNFGEESFSLKLSEDKDPEFIIASADEKWGGNIKLENIKEEGAINIPEESFLIFRM